MDGGGSRHRGDRSDAHDWANDENGNQRIEVEVELVAADRLTVTPTNGGRTVTYEPTESNPGCD